jgi:hypothetical protein
MKKIACLLSFIFLISLSACGGGGGGSGSSSGSGGETYVGTWLFASYNQTFTFTESTWTANTGNCNAIGTMTVTGENPWTMTTTVTSATGCGTYSGHGEATITVSSDNTTMTWQGSTGTFTGTRQ